MARVVFHVDLDYFYAQVEEEEHPEYKDKPVVVCVYSGRTEESGAVSTANYLARKYGVKSGMPIVWAKRVLKDKDAVFLPVDVGKYRTVSDKIMDVLRGYGEKFEQVSVDEAFLEVTESVGRDYGEAEKLGREIKDEIRRLTGLTCSVGVGPNRLVAKIAANHVKPDGLTVVLPEAARDFLSPLPIGRLYGVGKKTEKIMLEKGLKTVGALAGHPVEDLVRTFGKVLGVYFHEAANGIDDSEVHEREGPKSLSRIVTLKKDTRDPAELIPVLVDLSESLTHRILSEKLAYRTVSIVVVSEDMSMSSRSLTLEDMTTEKGVLVAAVKRLLDEYLRDSRLNLRRIGVRISTLSPIGVQRSLSTYMG